jgi:hypothetical protein
MDAVVLALLQAGAWMAAIAGLFFVSRQLKLATKSYIDLHDWNRRNAAQTLFFDFNLNFSMTGVQSALNYTNLNLPIEVEALLQKFSEHPQLQLDVAKLLNFFECLAVGIQNGVYDKQIIEVGFKGLMQHGWLVFKNYIEFRQRGTIYKSWETFTKVIHAWEAEEKAFQERQHTGK